MTWFGKRGNTWGNLVLVSMGVGLWSVLMIGAVRWVLLLGVEDGRRWIQGSNTSEMMEVELLTDRLVRVEHTGADIEGLA